MTDKSEDETADRQAKEAGKQQKSEEPKKPAFKSKKDELADAHEEAAKYLDMARRTQADFDNYRKRTERDNAEYRKYATSGLVTELLNIADDLERALSSMKQGDPAAVGVGAVRNNLMKVLNEQGLKEIPTDVDFDPNVHEALMVAEGDEDGKIAEVYQKGYMMHDRVLRYAKVKVTKKKEAPKASEPEETPAEKHQDNKEGD